MAQADDTASTTSCNLRAQQTIHSLKEEAARRKKRLSDLLVHTKEIVLKNENTLTPKSIMVVKTQADSLHNKGLRRVKLNQIRRRRMQLQNQLSKDTASCSCSIAAGGTASGSGKDDESAIFSIGSSSLSGPVVDHLPMDENSVSPQRKGATIIDFSITTIREHIYIPGDNPAVMDGPPLSISWNHHSEVNISVDEFEQAKIYEEVKTQGELRMPASRRSQSKYNYHGKLFVTFGDDYLISSHHNQY